MREERRYPYVTLEISGTLVGKLWSGDLGSKQATFRVTKQAGRKDRQRVRLADWVREATSDGDFSGPCVIEEAEISVTREFPSPSGGGTYVKRVRMIYAGTLEGGR